MTIQPLIDSLGANGFIPHGVCLSWSPGLLWLHVLSDALIVLAYYSIPLTLIYFIKNRKDLPYPWLFTMFGLFIVACGTTHLLSAITIWIPLYWLDGAVKAITAVVSVGAAIATYWVIPNALQLRGPAQLEAEVQHKSRELVAMIAELKKTQAALQASEQRLKLAVASGKVGIWDYNLQTQELIWDDTMFALYGAKREAFSGAYDAWSTRLHPDDKSSTEAALQDAVAGIKDYAPEFRVIWPNGEVRYIKGHATVVRDDNGTPLRMIGTNWDNYEHANALHQLQLAHTAINNSQCAYFWINRHGEVIDANDYACRALGYQRRQLIGLLLWDFDAEFCAASWPGAWAKLKQHGMRSFESRHRRKDGSTFPVELTTNYLAVGGEEYCFSFSLDITERKQADLALQESQNLLKTLIRAIPDLIWLKDREGVYLFCNTRFEDFFGAAETDITGKTDFDFVTPELADAFRHYDRLAIVEGRSTVNEEWITFARDGHRELLETTKTPLFDAQGRTIGVIGIGHDITGRKLAEQKLQDAYAALQQSQAMLIRQEKLAAMGTLVGGVAHEVNNPLMGIGGYINFAYESMDDGKPREMLGKALKEVERIARIVRGMLVFGRQTDPSKQEADVIAVLDSLASLIAAEYKECGVTLSMDTASRPPPAAINDDSLQQVLLNLLLNARDSLAGIPPPREVTISTGLSDSMLEIAVCDNGPGVADAIISRIFDPFFSTKDPGSGTGLGLAVSRQMAEEVNGSLEYRPGPAGACFILRLPTLNSKTEG
ncbi:two-component system, LuxR family, sensor histidine kinase DctS [Methylococcales bacterium]|nr:two-component system, LuxR family, sensor histidine kinase DctS [Methylococcales bacterium]